MEFSSAYVSQHLVYRYVGIFAAAFQGNTISPTVFGFFETNLACNKIITMSNI